MSPCNCKKSSGFALSGYLSVRCFDCEGTKSYAYSRNSRSPLRSSSNQANQFPQIPIIQCGNETTGYAISENLEMKLRCFKLSDQINELSPENMNFSDRLNVKLYRKPRHKIEQALGYICVHNETNGITVQHGCYKRSYGKAATLPYLKSIRDRLFKNAPDEIILDLVFEYLNLKWVISKIKDLEKKEEEKLQQKKDVEKRKEKKKREMNEKRMKKKTKQEENKKSKRENILGIEGAKEEEILTKKHMKELNQLQKKQKKEMNKLRQNYKKENQRKIGNKSKRKSVTKKLRKKRRKNLE
jgi:hypothetical protein